jgi:hypothetical protein
LSQVRYNSNALGKDIYLLGPLDVQPRVRAHIFISTFNSITGSFTDPNPDGEPYNKEVVRKVKKSRRIK